MPSFVIAHGSGRSDHFNATLCNPNVADRPAGPPQRRARADHVDGESRSILSTVGGSGTVTYLISGSTKKLRNAERRIALEKVHAALRQLAALMRPLAAASEEPELATEALGLAFNWFSEEAERLAAPPRCDDEEASDG